MGDFSDSALDHAFLASGPVLLDPVPSDTFTGLMDGPATANDNILPSLGLDAARPVEAVASDGVTEVILRIPANNAGDQFTIKVLNDQSGQGSQDRDGAVGNPGDRTFSQTEVTVSAINVTTDPSTGAHAPFAFAVYRAPIDFVRQNQDGINQKGNCNFKSFSSGFGFVSSTPEAILDFQPNLPDDQLSCRFVTLQVNNLSSGEVTAGPSNNPFNVNVTILRPPVVMIHGLWDNWQTWNNFSPLVSGAGSVDGRFYVGRVNYDNLVGPSIVSSDPSYLRLVLNHSARANSLGFVFNAPTVLAQSSGWIDNFKENHNPLGIPAAAVQADIVAHSMGGNIARTMVLQTGFLNDSTFGQGVIHKLITVDTPHLGSPVASQMISPEETGVCVQPLLALDGKFVFNTVLLPTGVSTGAIADLQLSSPALINIANQNPHPIPVAMIAGIYNNFSSFSPTAISLLCQPSGADPIALDLSSTRWPTVFFNNAPNDVIVSETSQLDGLTGLDFSSYFHSSGARGIGFGGPSVLDASVFNPNDHVIPDAVISLLNTPLTAAVFNTLNP